MRRHRIGSIAVAFPLAVLLHATAAAPALGHGVTMDVGSAAPAAGALIAAHYDFAEKVVVTPTFSAGGVTLYTSEFPSFLWQVDNQPPDLYALTPGTAVRMELVANDPATSVMLGSTIIDAPGESALIGVSTPGDHVHPLWRLILPNGTFGDYPLSFKLTTTAAAYSQSTVYTVTITNIQPPATATPSATSTVTPTATPPATATVTPTATPSLTNTAATASATATPTATALALCGATPPPACAQAQRAALTIKLDPDPRKRRLAWKWSTGDPVDPIGLGDPAATTNYALCLYDTAGTVPALAVQVAIPAHSQCGGAPCWRTTRRGDLKYHDPDAARGGIRSISLRAGAQGRVIVKSAGSAAALPGLPLHQDPTVSVYLANSIGTCWGAQFAAPAAHNDGARFSDAIP